MTKETSEVAEPENYVDQKIPMLITKSIKKLLKDYNISTHTQKKKHHLLSLTKAHS